jgi:hypothetical protein
MTKATIAAESCTFAGNLSEQVTQVIDRLVLQGVAGACRRYQREDEVVELRPCSGEPLENCDAKSRGSTDPPRTKLSLCLLPKSAPAVLANKPASILDTAEPEGCSAPGGGGGGGTVTPMRAAEQRAPLNKVALEGVSTGNQVPGTVGMFPTVCFVVRELKP